jgi:predicted CXXCH cytochrome family protein
MKRGIEAILSALPVRLLRRRRPWVAGLVVVLMAGAALSWLFWLRSPAQRSHPGGVPAPEAGVLSVRLPPPPAPRPDQVVTFAEGCITAECHASMSRRFAAPGRAMIHEPVARLACDECHGPDAGGHTFPLLRTGESLCGQCHQAAGPGLFVHRAIADTGCTACHDPHISQGKFLLIRESVDQTCATCHRPSAGEHAHWPYAAGECSSCHEPHGSDTRALLRSGSAGGVEGHCGVCHTPIVEAMAAAPHSHRDVERSCLTCHEAHASNFKRLQRFEPRLGCVGCHDDVAAAVASARVSHDAVLTGDQCISCHEPHASTSAAMLRDDHAPVCMTCHSGPLLASDGRQIPEMATVMTTKAIVHGQVASGNCAACHAVHGGQHARLLRELNPKVMVGGFDVLNYALCFSCHDQNLAFSDSADATGFRQGTINLHRVHLQAGDRSRSCASCHAAHWSDHPRLIAESVAYDGSAWMMPMGFILTPDGGGCSPGCHEPLRYSRKLRPEMQDQREAP